MKNKHHNSSKLRHEKQRVGIWIRTNTLPEAQVFESRARAYAQARGDTVTQVYHARICSGRNVISHPEAKRLMNDIASGKIDVVVIDSLNRLGRNTRELLQWFTKCRESNVVVHSLKESIDTGTSVWSLFWRMTAALDEWEREEIRSRSIHRKRA